MSYIPTEWQTGDIVTAEKLNKLEEGVAASGGGGGGGLLVTVSAVSEGVMELDKNYNEILTALYNGINPVIIADMGGQLKFPALTGIEEDESKPYYGVTLEFNGDSTNFSSESPTGVLTSIGQ